MTGHLPAVTRRLLIIDDDPLVVGAFRDYFADRGYRVDTALNGGDGVMQVRQHPPDVILLDVRMPGMDGLEVLRQILLIAPALPVIIVTGHLDVAPAQEALRMGAVGYVRKPCDLEELERLVAGAAARAPGSAGTPASAQGDDPEGLWARLRQHVRSASGQGGPSGRLSLWDRLESAVAAAHHAARAGEATAVETHLRQVELLLRVAVELGDLPLQEMLALEAALVRLRGQPAASDIADHRGPPARSCWGRSG